VTDQPAAFPALPYSMRDTAASRKIGGPRLKSHLAAAVAITKFMQSHPQADPVAVDAEGRPVSVDTLWRLATTDTGRPMVQGA
jgi:hypothetical protein